MRMTLACVALCATLAYAQVPPQYNLKVSETLPTSEPASGIFMPIRCDADGNLYFRTLAGQRTRDALRTVIEVGSNGQVKNTFSFTKSPETDQLDPYDFAVSPSGDIYATAASPTSVYVIRFDSHGKMQSKTKLEHLFQPNQLAVFEGGEYLISGTELPKAGDPTKPAGFAAIFDKSGRVVKQLNLTEGAPSGQDGGEEELPFEYGAAVMGKDGNAYLLRHSSPAMVYVVSSAGQIVRTMKVDAPLKGLMPEAIHYSDGKLLIAFADRLSQRFEVVNAQTGEPYAEYVGSPETGTAIGCYDGKEFTSLVSKKGKLQLLRLVPGS